MNTSGPMTPTRMAAISRWRASDRGTLEGNVDDLQCGVFLQSVDVEFNADTGALDAAEGGHRMERAVLVHPGGAAFEASRQAGRFLYVVTPDRSTQPDFQRVRPRD